MSTAQQINELRGANFRRLANLKAISQAEVDIDAQLRKVNLKHWDFYQKAIPTLAKNIKTQDDAKQTRQANIDWYLNHHENYLNSDQAVKDANTSLIAKEFGSAHSQAINLSNMSPGDKNRAWSSSPTYWSQIAKLDAQSKVSGYEAWVTNQMSTSTETLYTETNDGRLVPFKIKDARTEDQKAKAYNHLREQYITDNFSGLSREYLSLPTEQGGSGVFETIRKLENKTIYPNIVSEANINWHFDNREAAKQVFMLDPSAANYQAMVEAYSIGVWTDGKPMNRIQAYVKLKEDMTAMMKAGIINNKNQLIAIANSELPKHLQTDKIKTYADKWPSRWGWDPKKGIKGEMFTTFESITNENATRNKAFNKNEWNGTTYPTLMEAIQNGEIQNTEALQLRLKDLNYLGEGDFKAANLYKALLERGNISIEKVSEDITNSYNNQELIQPEKNPFTNKPEIAALYDKQKEITDNSRYKEALKAIDGKIKITDKLNPTNDQVQIRDELKGVYYFSVRESMKQNGRSQPISDDFIYADNAVEQYFISHGGTLINPYENLAKARLENPNLNLISIKLSSPPKVGSNGFYSFPHWNPKEINMITPTENNHILLNHQIKTTTTAGSNKHQVNEYLTQGEPLTGAGYVPDKDTADFNNHIDNGTLPTVPALDNIAKAMNVPKSFVYDSYMKSWGLEGLSDENKEILDNPETFDPTALGSAKYCKENLDEAAQAISKLMFNFEFADETTQEFAQKLPEFYGKAFIPNDDWMKDFTFNGSSMFTETVYQSLAYDDNIIQALSSDEQFCATCFAETGDVDYLINDPLGFSPAMQDILSACKAGLRNRDVSVPEEAPNPYDPMATVNYPEPWNHPSKSKFPSDFKKVNDLKEWNERMKKLSENEKGRKKLAEHLEKIRQIIAEGN